MKKNRGVILCLLIPIIGGIIIGLLTSFNMDYSSFTKPPFAPPAYLFPIVWTILYLLMGISCALICKSNNRLKKPALKIYYLQLFLNFIWSILFFTLKWRFIAFLDIILLIYFVIQMIVIFCKINKTAGILQVPYLLWILFASYLNLAIILLN